MRIESYVRKSTCLCDNKLFWNDEKVDIKEYFLIQVTKYGDNGNTSCGNTKKVILPFRIILNISLYVKHIVLCGATSTDCYDMYLLWSTVNCSHTTHTLYQGLSVVKVAPLSHIVSLHVR